MGRESEAEVAFRQEMRDFPGAPPAYAGLAMLYASQGKEGEARGILTELVSAQTPEAIFTAARTYEILGDGASASALRAQARRSFPARATAARRRAETWRPAGSRPGSSYCSSRPARCFARRPRCLRARHGLFSGVSSETKRPLGPPPGSGSCARRTDPSSPRSLTRSSLRPQRREPTSWPASRDSRARSSARTIATGSSTSEGTKRFGPKRDTAPGRRLCSPGSIRPSRASWIPRGRSSSGPKRSCGEA